MRKIINAFALLLIIFVVLCIFDIVSININDYEVPLLVILGAVALINVSISVKTYLIAPGRYTPDPYTFVDRKSQINNIITMVRNGRSIINVFGITGIGVTRLQQFTADIINRRIPFLLRRKYCNNIFILFGKSYKSYYINVSTATNISDIVSMLCASLLIGVESVNSVAEFCEILKKKLKTKRLVFFFDGIYNRDQMIILEELASKYFPLRSKDTFVFGTHQKSLSYQYNYKYIEILEFNKNDLMILAQAHKVDLNEKDSIHLYEITDGIPMFAYLLLKDSGTRELVNSKNLKDIYAYLKQFVVPSLLSEEHIVLEKIALLSLSSSVIGKNELQLIDLLDSDDIICTLHYKGLIQFSKVRYEITIPKAIAKSFLAYSFTQEEMCLKLYQYYKKTNKKHFAVLYLLLSTQHDTSKERFIEKNLETWIKERDTLTILVALSPSVEFSSDIKNKYPRIYNLYMFACIYMFSACGDYPKAKQLLDKIAVDEGFLKRYDVQLDDLNFNLHFLWADVEHLLNNYSGAIQIVHSLISNSNQYAEMSRLPQLYWMNAHCMRHQAKDLKESLNIYISCEKESLKQNNLEYVIRSLHGQICIALITNNNKFDYANVFKRLSVIYEQNPEHWESYKYTTYKYKSIYKRIYDSDKVESELLLFKAKEGFLKIQKRNLYDTFFELGEYYRYYNQYEDSKKYYNLCIEFAQCNFDYNLESLSELGIILINIAAENRYEQEKLLYIIRKAQEKDLNLSVNYAQIILENLKNKNTNFALHLFNP